MKYFPKSRIIPNQKSSPGQFLLPDGREYIGPYYTTFDGKNFTGSSPITGKSNPLTPLPPIEDDFKDPIREGYDRLFTQSPKIGDLIDPTPFTPTPTEADYQVGKITRYLARQRNGTQFKIMEISKQTFDDIQNRRNGANFALWKTISIFWQISGPLRDERVDNIKTRAGIIDTNQRILDTAEKNFIGIKQYLSDLKQFSR
jgi:hypothetical protein